MRCPDCFAEVLEGDQNCPYCGADLEDIMDLAPNAKEETGFIPLVTVSDETEAYCIKDLLEGNGIPVLLEPAKSDIPSLYSGDDDVWGEILVNRSMSDLAYAIVNNFNESGGVPVNQEQIEPDEEEEEEESEQTEYESENSLFTE